SFFSVRDEKAIQRCMNVLVKGKCLTDQERKFFEDLEMFFGARALYLCRNAERVSDGKHKAAICNAFYIFIFYIDNNNQNTVCSCFVPAPCTDVQSANCESQLNGQDIQ